MIGRETRLALLAATSEFAAAKPWEYMCDSDVVGLGDPKTGEARLVTVLGNAREVFGAVFYRRASGLRWLLNALVALEDYTNLDSFAVMDALKVELVRKNELRKEDLTALKTLDFTPKGKGPVWPQFQSVEPGWQPWFIDQTEAEQLLVDLPRLTAFTTFFRDHSDLFHDRPPTEIPFLPSPMPNRRLKAGDLEWRTLVASPEKFAPFKPTDEQLDQLRKLKREAKTAYEYGSRIMMGGAVLEKGRPCFSRINLLVKRDSGIVLGFDLSLATIPFAECAGAGLVKTLVNGGFLPGTLLINDSRLVPILGVLCDVLKIDLVLSEGLDALAGAQASLENYMGR